MRYRDELYPKTHFRAFRRKLLYRSSVSTLLVHYLSTVGPALIVICFIIFYYYVLTFCNILYEHSQLKSLIIAVSVT